MQGGYSGDAARSVSGLEIAVEEGPPPAPPPCGSPGISDGAESSRGQQQGLARRWDVRTICIVVLVAAVVVVPAVYGCLSLFSPSSKSETTRRRPPNIVLFFADNLGYGDVGCFGAPTARTPNVDRLAREGMKFRNWNSGAVLCSPSRASLLTGRLPPRVGVYPRVFYRDAALGLPLNETTLADQLRRAGYATGIVGKWHLGQRPAYLPTNRGFDEWYGIPYHMSDGSLDGQRCGFDTNRTAWLPVFAVDNKTATDHMIAEQPANLSELAVNYAGRARDFVRRHAGTKDGDGGSAPRKPPFFLYFPFSHVHQLCPPQRGQWTSRLFKDRARAAGGFVGAVEETDWLTGQVLEELRLQKIEEETLVIWTSDNGPWTEEQNQAGSVGPFEGLWARRNINASCVACPSGFSHAPVPGKPRNCVYAGGVGQAEPMDGIPCGEDIGLGSTWEGNMRMPALARWPGKIAAGSVVDDLVSSLDVFPTLLALAGVRPPPGLVLDGLDISRLLLGTPQPSGSAFLQNRTLFFWRDGLKGGPLPAPYCRVDLFAMKRGPLKAHFWTKSAHYIGDEAVWHDPPLLFDVMADPAEAFPLDHKNHAVALEAMQAAAKEHKRGMTLSPPMTLERDSKYTPCADPSTGCRTSTRSGREQRAEVAAVAAAAAELLEPGTMGVGDEQLLNEAMM